MTMGSKQDLFGQLWKEYAKSDSRYMTRDGFTVCMETITAVNWSLMQIYIVSVPVLIACSSYGDRFASS